MFRIHAILLVVFIGLGPTPVAAQEPEGLYAQTGVVGIPGLGIQVGAVDAGRMLTREINMVADFRPAGSEGTFLVATAIGGSIRIFGIERTIGGAAYRGYDVDLGLRIGPGLLFQVNETRVSKNRRFELFSEPFLRFSTVRETATWYLEAGTHRPSLRAGVWFAL